MKLEKYLEELKVEIDREIANPNNDVRKSGLYKRFNIYGDNDEVFIGGSFNGLVEYLMKEDSWIPKGVHGLEYKFDKGSVEERIRKFIEIRKQEAVYFRDLSYRPDGKTSLIEIWKEDIFIPKGDVTFIHMAPTLVTLDVLNDEDDI